MLHLFCVWNTYVNLPWMVINLLYITVFLMLNRLERHQLY
jgi:hypothetical protein